jgi:hypothetical protein
LSLCCCRLFVCVSVMLRLLCTGRYNFMSYFTPDVPKIPSFGDRSEGVNVKQATTMERDSIGMYTRQRLYETRIHTQLQALCSKSILNLPIQEADERIYQDEDIFGITSHRCLGFDCRRLFGFILYSSSSSSSTSEYGRTGGTHAGE